ncbi:methylaspartate mutase accessory protein GlmL [Bacteroides propionicifaciens]|uniref:methylaspartate mutase accessory protein GlmL n=1 Tax=Bacteroides propionicifaciens TaxID=392838 RepID=UPI000370E0BD|nr:methylaspartate mutase accessory protein GlmL [Bacteroides propionicifaciens]
MIYLTVDFGSTYTKLTVIDGKAKKILGTSSAFTTISSDVMCGFEKALSTLKQKIGEFQYDKLLICSSAAGGLKMVALGLVPDLTAKAAKMAAASAGAKVIKTYAYEISRSEAEEISQIQPDIVLLCGGTDGGNKAVVLANAHRLAQSKVPFAIIYAGNKSASDEVADIFTAANRDFIITDNVMPQFNVLNTVPAKECIHKLFITRIIQAKGLSRVQNLTEYEIIPTPLAVLNACELLSQGTNQSKGIGDFMAIDIGGATTDIYSMSRGYPSIDNVMYKGLPEPYGKRTVEGDLGMRYSLTSLLENINLDLLSKTTGIPATQINEWVEACDKEPNRIAPPTSTAAMIEQILARQAVQLAVERHVGVYTKAFTPMGEVYTLSGKDLINIPSVIGIGGVIVNSQNPISILRGCLYSASSYEYAKPKSPQFLCDSKYIFASMGLLSLVDPELALSLLKQEIKILTLDTKHYENSKQKIVTR